MAKEKKVEEVIKNLNPEEKIENISKDIKKIEKRSQEVVAIKSEEQYQSANTFLVEIKGRIKRVKELQEEYVSPLKAQVKKLEALFKEPQKKYEAIELEIKKSMIEFRTEQEKIARKEEERLRALQEKREEKAREKGKTIDPTPVPTIARMESTVKSDAGSSTASKVLKFEITNVHALPEEIKKQILEKALEKGVADTVVRPHAISVGVEGKIDGVRIWEEFAISVRA
jgi:DNA-binding helix-hairpin-helix protein with protein kinase domain